MYALSDEPIIRNCTFVNIIAEILDGIVEMLTLISTILNLDYAPEAFVSDKTKYILTEPILCSFQSENDIYVIQCNLPDLIGTGKTKYNAVSAFNKEFVYLYKYLKLLEDRQMTKLIQFTKSMINQSICIES